MVFTGRDNFHVPELPLNEGYLMVSFNNAVLCIMSYLRPCSFIIQGYVVFQLNLINIRPLKPKYLPGYSHIYLR